MRKRLILLFALVLVISLSSGCLKKESGSNSKDSGTTTTTTTTVKRDTTNNNHSYIPWVVSYDWSNVQDNNKTPLFANKVSMPVNIEEFLKKYETAEIWVNNRTDYKYINAKDIINYTGKYYEKSIFLFEKKQTENKGSADFRLAIVPTSSGYQTMAECLKSGRWRASTTPIFEYPTSDKSSYLIKLAATSI